MKVYGTVNNSSFDGNEDAPLLSKSNGTKSGSNFKRIGVATLLASGAAFAIASGSNRISVGSSAMRLGDALDDAKAGALLKFFYSYSLEERFEPRFGGSKSPIFSFLFKVRERRKSAKGGSRGVLCVCAVHFTRFAGRFLSSEHHIYRRFVVFVSSTFGVRCNTLFFI